MDRLPSIASRMPASVASRMAMWVRATGDILLNSPDGWMDTNGPVWWYGSDRGAPTTPEGYATLATVGRATSLIVDPIVDAPWRLRRVSADPMDNAGAALPLPRWVSDPQLARPDERFAGDTSLVPAPVRLTAPEFWGQLLTWCVWWGRGTFMFHPDAEGRPTAGAMRILDPRQVTTVDAESGYQAWRVGTNGPVTDRDGMFRLNGVRWRVVCFRDSPLYGDDGSCMGVLQRYAGSLAMDAQVEAYARGTFRSGVPAGVLRYTGPDLDQERADALKRAWMDAHGGGTRSVAVLNATTEFSPLQFSPVDAALVESGRMARIAVAHAFGMHGHWLDAASDSKTYANVNDTHRQLWAHTQQPRAARMMALLSSLLPAGQELMIDHLAITDLNPADRVAWVVALRQAGLMTWQEGRDRLGLPRIDEEPEPIGGGSAA